MKRIITVKAADKDGREVLLSAEITFPDGKLAAYEIATVVGDFADRLHAAAFNGSSYGFHFHANQIRVKGASR